MKFTTIDRNWIDVVGKIWMPAVTCAQTIKLSARDMADIGEPTRENVDLWLATHAGDFQSIEDFHAIIGDVELPWLTDEGECAFKRRVRIQRLHVRA